MTAPVSLLVGSDALGWHSPPVAVGKRWKHGQHGPADASFQVPCRPFGALDPRLRRDQQLFISVGARCVWSGYLLPVSSAQSHADHVTEYHAPRREDDPEDEDFCERRQHGHRLETAAEAKASRQRFTKEQVVTAVIIFLASIATNAIVVWFIVRSLEEAVK